MVASAKVYKTNNATTSKDDKTFKDEDLVGLKDPAKSQEGWAPINWFIEHVQKPVLEYVGEQGFHMGYSSNGDGTNGSLDVSVGPVEYNTNSGPKINPYIPTQQKAPNTVPATPAAYSRTSARTATDIAQGGMTKQEVQEFNMKHPNETVMRGQ